MSSQRPHTDDDPRPPLCVLTGFLGSGKTTLLRRVLATARQRIAVLVNEVADLPIDRHLLAEVDEDVLALPGGCVCCVARGDLHAALARLAALRPARVVLETSGLADPAPLCAAFGADPRLAAAVRLAGVVAVVDCERAEGLFATEPEASRQLDFADRIALSKADIAPHRLDAARELLERCAPGRDVRVLTPHASDVDWLFAAPFSAGAPDAAARWLHAPHGGAGYGHDHGAVATRAIAHPRPVDVDAVQLWLRLVTQLDGERLLRIKAIARCAHTGAVFALHSAGRSVSPPQRLLAAPSGLAGAEVVVIARGMPERALAAALAALRGALGS